MKILTIKLFLLIIFGFSLSYAAKNSNNKCSQFDQEIATCNPFNCEMRLPMPSGSGATMQMTILGMHENKCFYRSFMQVVTRQQMTPFKIILKCQLSSDGINAVKSEFEEFKNGNTDIYMRSSQNPIIKKECRLQD